MIRRLTTSPPLRRFLSSPWSLPLSSLLRFLSLLSHRWLLCITAVQSYGCVFHCCPGVAHWFSDTLRNVIDQPPPPLRKSLFEPWSWSLSWSLVLCRCHHWCYVVGNGVHTLCDLFLYKVPQCFFLNAVQPFSPRDLAKSLNSRTFSLVRSICLIPMTLVL